MRLVTLFSTACVAAGAAAFEYPDFVPLHKRQAPGTPQYDCHANCGGIITDSRSDGYCDSSDFESKLSDCLDCALEYDIWKYYGNSVSSAAEGCGLDATPVEPISSSTSAAATETETSTETETETETETATESSDPRTTTKSTTVSSPVIPTSTATSTPSDSSDPTSATSTPSDSQFTGAATLNTPSGVLIGGLIGSLFAALMQ